MIQKIRFYFRRWVSSKNIKYDLDVLLSKAHPEEGIQHRLVWLVELMAWIRYRGDFYDAQEVVSEKVPSARLRFLLMILERNPKWKSAFAKTMRSIVHDIKSMELFCEIGLPQEFNFWAEFNERLMAKVLPEAPLNEDVTNLFTALFPDAEDPNWLSTIDPPIMESFLKLFYFEVEEDETGWNTLHRDMEEAILCLGSQVQATGLSRMIRSRLATEKTPDLPFYKLIFYIDNLFRIYHSGNADLFYQEAAKFRGLIMECQESFRQVYRYLHKHGVNVSIVYHMERAQSRLQRIDDLLGLMMHRPLNIQMLLYFLVKLIEDNHERKSISSLFNQNTRLLARKIVERNTETGEHYLATDRKEFYSMFNAAAGGGALTAITVHIKFLLHSLHLAGFFEGFLYSLNYASSFVFMQFTGLTLATKQPSMTAPALAVRMQELDGEPSLEYLVDEIVQLIRSQMASIFGNVSFVVPAAIAVDIYVFLLLDHHVLDRASAIGVIQSLNIFSFVPLYGFFTGVILWTSSMFAGWADNWFVYNKLKEALTYNRKLHFIFGESNSKKIGDFFGKHISNFAGNISLGFLLGMVPTIGAFFSLPISALHVTLSSGSLATAACVFGTEVFQLPAFWLAVCGIFCIGFMNLGVSFVLALFLAIRARNIKAPQRRRIYRAVWRRFISRPQTFFFPPKDVK